MDLFYPKTKRPIPAAPIKRKLEDSSEQHVPRTRPKLNPKPKVAKDLFQSKTKIPQHELIASGPLKGLDTSLLDKIRKKEAAAAERDPEKERKQELLGIAPEIVRIICTIFMSNKKQVLNYDKVVDFCFRGLKSNYTSATIIECLLLLDKVAPEWVSVVEITRGKYMRFNRKHTLPQLLELVNKFKV